MPITPVVAYSLAVAIASGSSLEFSATKGFHPQTPKRYEMWVPRLEPDIGSEPDRYKRDPTWPNLQPLFQGCKPDLDWRSGSRSSSWRCRP
jgi:hypothetical protein